MKSILIYFDLRKYGYIEKNKNKEETLDILSFLHTKIEDYMIKLKAEIYKVQTDTAVYIIKGDYCKDIDYELLELKNIIDGGMFERGLPSKIHICVIIEECYSGIIKTNTKEYFNVFGPLMNKLEKVIYIVENIEDNETKEGIIILKGILLNCTIKKEIKQLGEELYLI